MADYGEYRQPSRGPSLVRPAADAIRRSLTRNSYYSHNTPSISATTRSWVYSTQQNPPGPPPPPPPLPIPLPSPVWRLRPLPNPHVQQHRATALHAVNFSEPLDREEYEERMNIIAKTPAPVKFLHGEPGSKKARNQGTSIPGSVSNSKDNKRTPLRGFVKSIRRLPKIMFGYGASKRATTLRRRGTSGTDGEGTSTTRTGNTLPQYVSNPPTPVAGPIPSNLHHYTHQPMGLQMPIQIPTSVTASVSPPPEVVRLDDVRRHRPNFRIIPPSAGIARSETAHFFPGPTTRSSQFTDNPTDSSSSAANAAERTTVMMYHHDHRSPTPTPTPPLPLSRQISSNGPPGRLSYTGSEQVVRPTSFHGGSQAPPPIEIPTSITRIATTASHPSYVSQVTTLPPTLPLQIRRSSSQQQSQASNQPQPQLQPQSQPRQQPHQQTSPQHRPSSTPPIIESSEPIQSPISAYPQPTTDYLKMALSPPHSLQHHTTALTHLTSATNPSSSRITSFSHDPSFSNTLSPIEKFFKTLYHMPWVAYERITVDYLPGKVGRVHGHALGREMSGRRVKDDRGRKEGDRRRRVVKDTRERGRERERRRRKERRGGAGGHGRGHGDGDGKPVSWYKAVLSRSRRANEELDLLNSDLGSHSSPMTTASLGAAIALGLENLPVDAASPRLAAASAAAAAVKVGKSADRERERERRQRERKEDLRNKQERTSRSHRHRHRHHQDPHNHHRERQRQNIGSIGSPDDPDVSDQNEDDELNLSPSPLIPAVYPFHYPPYQYTYPYTSFTMPGPQLPPTLPIMSAHVQSQSQPPSQPQHPLSELPSTDLPAPSSANHTQQGQQLSQPLLYSPAISHPGYTAAAQGYQPMIAPSTTGMMAPQVYLLHSTSHGQLQAQTQSLSSSSRMEHGSSFTGGNGALVGDAGAGNSSRQQTLEQ